MLSNLRKQNTRRLAKLRNAGPPQVAGWPGSPRGGQRQSEAVQASAERGGQQQMPDFGDDRVMACSQEDMQRWIRGFTGQPELTFSNGKVSFTDRGVDFTVTIEELPVRKLGLVKFRDSRIQFSYPDEQAQSAREWIAVFDHHTQRGGG